jgi:Flp pilus assembly protein TadD
MKTGMIKISVLCLLAGAASSCGTMTFDEHEEKYRDLSVNDLLNADNLSDERRELLNTTFNQQAVTEAAAGDHVNSEKHARMSLKLDANDVNARYSLAEALLAQGKYGEAETIFAKLTEDSPSAKVSQGYGLTLLARKNTSSAQTWLNSAVAEEPQLWRAWNGLGVIYDMSQSWALAEQAFKAGIAIDGHNPTLNNNLGLSYMRQNRFTEAIIAFENVQTLQNGQDQAHMNYRTALAMNGDMEKAVSGATDTQVAQLYNNLGVAAIKSGEPGKAIEYLKKAISINPSYYPNAVKNLEIAKSSLS